MRTEVRVVYQCHRVFPLQLSITSQIVEIFIVSYGMLLSPQPLT